MGIVGALAGLPLAYHGNPVLIRTRRVIWIRGLLSNAGSRHREVDCAYRYTVRSIPLSVQSVGFRFLLYVPITGNPNKGIHLCHQCAQAGQTRLAWWHQLQLFLATLAVCAELFFHLYGKTENPRSLWQSGRKGWTLKLKNNTFVECEILESIKNNLIAWSARQRLVSALGPPSLIILTPCEEKFEVQHE